MTVILEVGAFIRADPLRAIRLLAWLTCIGALSPAVWRWARRRARSLDPIWVLVFLLAVNRLSYLFQVSDVGSNIAATMLAFTMAIVSWGYQRHDR